MKNILARTLLFLCLLCFAQGAEAYTTTTNYTFQLPQVNNAIDQNQWGAELNSNFTSLDALLLTASNNTTVSATGTTAMDSTYRNKLILANATSAAFNITLPAPATVATGFKFYVKKTDSSANAVTILPNAAETIDGASSSVLSSQYQALELITDGTNWYAAIVFPNSKTLSMNTQVFTGSGTYTPTAGMVADIVETCSGGGGGGGAGGNTNVLGGGGGSGGYDYAVISAASVGASQTITIGAGGLAGSSAGGTGGTGGTTSFGAIISCTGGLGGVGSTSFSAQNAGGAGGTCTGGNAFPGHNGGNAFLAGSNLQGISGFGADSKFGAGGAPVSNFANTNTVGNPGTGHCSGGSGAVLTDTGGAGTGGEIIVTEFIYH